MQYNNINVSDKKYTKIQKKNTREEKKKQDI